MINNHTISKKIQLSDGREISLETGKLAKQADGSVLVRMNDTMLLCTVVSTKEFKAGADYLPLTVEYTEKYAASGRIPGGFFKREARLSNYEILISRLVDRAIRPLFPSDYYSDIQVMITLISSDENTPPDSLAALAASAAICISDIPFSGPISEVRVAKIDGQFVINPTVAALKNAEIDLIVAGSEKDLNMVEGSMKEVSEEDMLEAIKVAHEAINIQCRAQKEFVEMVGKAKFEYPKEPENTEIQEKTKNYFSDKIREIASKATAKKERSDLFKSLWKGYEAELTDEEKESAGLHKRYYEEVKKEIIRDIIFNEKIRLDGRKLDEIRDIECEVNFLPSAHGSALFTRGETQSLTSVTLGNKMDEQLVDGAFIQGYDKFILHYNFPPFSTGEVKPSRGPGRREIGHGNLAKRALEAVLPNEIENPYTIRIVSDILESNGSSSMATVCAGTLALMDAGIKIKKPVSGIAMGLIADPETNRFAILSDILGDEDHLGDMDFKVCGTEAGITACQMDIKVDGLSSEILHQALLQAKAGRLHILGKMKETMAEPNADYKPHAPRIEKFLVKNEFIGAIIGPGGKVIQNIQKETGTVVTITEQPDGQGMVEVSSKNRDSLTKAVNWITTLTEKPEEGKVYKGTVKAIKEFGAFVEFLPGKEGLLHNSEYDYDRNIILANELKQGDTLEVKLLEADKKTGKFRLSRKALLQRPPR